MPGHKIAWLPGDGIGKDVMEAARIVLDRSGLDAEYVPAEVGWECWEKYGNTVPRDTWKVLESTDVCLFGAITSKPGIKGFKSAILQIRQRFDLYTNMRPIHAYPSNPLNYRDDIDIMIFRENTEGLYKGIEFSPVPPDLADMLGIKTNPQETAISLRVLTREGCRRIIRRAFEYAASKGKKKVTVVEKANVLRKTGAMFLEEAENASDQFPDIEMEVVNVDAMAMWLIKNPQRYEVLVTTNLFGDIISDEASQLVGGLGFAASANIGDRYALFEPTHGSAPKYAGKYVTNPMAMLISTRLMLDHIGEHRIANALEKGIEEVIKEGKVRTYDMGGSSSTLEVAEAVAEKMEAYLND